MTWTLSITCLSSVVAFEENLFEGFDKNAPQSLKLRRSFSQWLKLRWSFSQWLKLFQSAAETSLVSLKCQQDNRCRVGQPILLSILPAGANFFFMQVRHSAYLPELAAFLASLLLPCAPSNRALMRSSGLAGFSETIGLLSVTIVNTHYFASSLKNMYSVLRRQQWTNKNQYANISQSQTISRLQAPAAKMRDRELMIRKTLMERPQISQT